MEYAGLLRPLPLAGFTGVDAATTALSLARARMSGWGVPCHWVQEDLQRWAEPPGDLHAEITCLFGLHHLADADTQRFLERAAARLAPGGVLLIGDVFREPGEERPAHVQRYVRRIREQWHGLAPDLQDHGVAHLESSDYPAAHDVFTAMAQAAGWRIAWIWAGHHCAERLAVLQRGV